MQQLHLQPKQCMESPNRAPRRLGVAVRVLGRDGLRSRDARRPEHHPHLSISLLYVRDILLYLAEQRIGCYRLADDLVPFQDRYDSAQFAAELEACRDILAEVGALARQHQVRLTMHAGLHLSLAAPDAGIAQRSAEALVRRAALLGALGCGPDSVITLHVGGVHGDRAAALERFAARFERLPHAVQRRLALEPDEDSFALEDLLRLHQQLGVPLIFDTLHYQIHNPSRIPPSAALSLALATWPLGQRPKIHLSSQRTEAHLLPAQGRQGRRVLGPRLGQHADFLNPFEVIAWLEAARGLPAFDMMLEAKAADLALLRLREDLARFAPEWAEVVS
jgi:UV DNA damage endonuclease